jgi:type IV pilus assembly protein PilA
MIVVAIIAILAAIAIPAYQNYLVRAQVSEGLSLVSAAKTGVDEFATNYGTFPSTNASAGVPNAGSISGSYVSQVAVGSGGLITVTYSGPKVNTAISGDLLVLSPTNNGGSVTWRCSPTGIHGTTVPLMYLPATCRN